MLILTCIYVIKPEIFEYSFVIKKASNYMSQLVTSPAEDRHQLTSADQPIGYLQLLSTIVKWG